MRLQELIENNNYTLYRFSKESGVPKTTLIDLCSGKTSIIKSQAITVKKIADTLGVTMEYIMTLDNSDKVYLEFNIPEFLKISINNYKKNINKENIVFTINANSNCPNDLFGDPYKISKILNVVLSNAIKNTEYGEISLNVSSSVVDAENHEFTFHIKNTGHAMKIENFERNFDELMRLNSKENNDIDADTLKIIAAKGLLNILGGKIDFINQTGQGTQYIIKINQKNFILILNFIYLIFSLFYIFFSSKIFALFCHIRRKIVFNK